jgi:hypothetical protein
MSINIFRPLAKIMVDNPIIKKVSMMPNPKLGLYVGLGCFSTLGFIRGCQEYFYFEIKDKKTSIEVKDYLCWSVYGLINASLYVNPSMSIFALVHEFHRAEMLMNNTFNEKKYYTNPFFGLLNDQKLSSSK